jgi:hypothetical protein
VEILLKVAIVLLGNHKELILQCDSFESIVEFIKTTLPEMGIIQMERVINQVWIASLLHGLLSGDKIREDTYRINLVGLFVCP